FQAVSRAPSSKILARHAAQLRIHDFHQAIERLAVAAVPCRQHPGDIVLVLVRHASKSYQKKFTPPLTIRAPVRGLQVDAPKNYWKGKRHEIKNSNHNHRPLDST